MIDPETEDLIQRALDGDTSAEENARLRALLVRDVDALAAEGRLRQLAQRLSAAEPPTPPPGFSATVMRAVGDAAQALPARRRWWRALRSVTTNFSPAPRVDQGQTTDVRQGGRSSTRGGFVVSRKLMWALAGAASVAVAIGLYVGVPPVDGTEGTIGAAKRYQAEQITAQDVKLQGMEFQRFVQSDAFRRIVNDPAARRAITSDAFQKAMSDSAVREALSHESFRNALATDAVLDALANDAVLDALSNDALLDALSQSASVDALANDAFKNALSNQAVREALSNDAFRYALSNDALRNALGSDALLNALSNDALLDALSNDALLDALANDAFRNGLANHAFDDALKNAIQDALAAGVAAQ